MSTPFSSRLFLDALNFAALRHREQRRKGEQGAPYVNHLIEVAHILATHGVETTDVLCAAVLHDVVEDTSATAEDLRRRFGNRVASIVLEVTDDARLPLWKQKVAQIDSAHLLSADAQNLRVADKISNLRGILVSPPENWSTERKLAYYAWANTVVERCSRAEPALRKTFLDVYESGLAALHLRESLQS